MLKLVFIAIVSFLQFKQAFFDDFIKQKSKLKRVSICLLYFTVIQFVTKVVPTIFGN